MNSEIWIYSEFMSVTKIFEREVIWLLAFFSAFFGQFRFVFE